jgi:putative DNA primase/helicase
MMPMAMANIEAAFLQALAEHGIAPAKALNLVADGRIHRYRVEGDKSGSENGWYVLYTDGAVPAGAFGSWKTGDSGTWCAKSESAMKPHDREDVRRKLQEAKAARDVELQQVRKDARMKAEKLWSIATPAAADVGQSGGTDAPAGVHPYLVSRAAKPFGVRKLKTMLVIPVRAADGGLMSLQMISPDGSKRFLTGGEVSGGYCAIGKPEGTLCICEGFATGASIREATGFAVAIAFNAGNLLPVAKVLREKFPALKIVICADNDQATEGNPGLSKAEGAAKQIGGMVSVPTFDAHESIDGKVPTDFNDMHRLRGLGAVRKAILAACENVTPIAAARSRKELQELIDNTDDFDALTETLVLQVANAGLAKPAFEFLMASIAKKAGVPKSALLDIAESSSGKGHGKPHGKPPEEDEQIKGINEKHAVLPIGGRVLILNREYDPVQHKSLFTFSAKTDFETRYCNRRVFDRGEEVGLGTYWLNHPQRAEYEGMVFSPGREVPGYLNLWSGWGVEPREGDCFEILNFIDEVICSGDDSLCEYIIRWFAHMVQRPLELPETALVFRGREGIGKNTLVDPFRDIVGREHFLLLSSLNQVTGRFSGHLANALLVFCNESVWGGDKSAQGVLKSMITDEYQPIEHKGRDLTMVKNYRRMVFATNENWAVPRGADDRRYVITDVSDARKGDYAYFAKVKEQMASGGTAALMHFLLSYDITGWHPRMIPNHLSERGWELKIRSGGSIVQWWFDMIQQGWMEKVEAHYADEDRYHWPDRCPTDVVQRSYLRWCTDHKVTHPEHSVAIGRALHDWGVRTSRPRVDNPLRKLYYLLPSLEESREQFSRRFSIPSKLWGYHDAGTIYE